jgi:hypothetical protein
MSGSARAVDGDAIRKIASFAGLSLPAERVERQVEGAQLLLDLVRGFEGLGLGYMFHADGSFGHVPMVARHDIPWDRPTGLTKQRVVVERDGDVSLSKIDSEGPE